MQPRNISSPRVVIVDGSEIDINEVQPVKIPLPRVVIDDGSETEINEV